MISTSPLPSRQGLNLDGSYFGQENREGSSFRTNFCLDFNFMQHDIELGITSGFSIAILSTQSPFK